MIILILNIMTLRKTNTALASVVVVSVAFGLIIGMSIQISEAQLTQKRIGPMTPKAYGPSTAGIVCGDRLCGETQHTMDIEEDTPIGEIDLNDPAAPHAKLLQIQKYKASNVAGRDAITYKITYQLTAGSENLRNIQIHAKTDVGEWNFSVESLNALKSSVNVARVKALDPDSITGEIVGYTITGPTSSDPNAPR